MRLLLFILVCLFAWGCTDTPPEAYETTMRQDSLKTVIQLDRVGWGERERVTSLTLGGDYRSNPAALDSAAQQIKLLVDTYLGQ